MNTKSKFHKPDGIGPFRSRNQVADRVRIPLYRSAFLKAFESGASLFFMHSVSLRQLGAPLIHSCFLCCVCPQAALTLIHNIATKNMGSLCSEHSFQSLDVAVVNATNRHDSTRQKVDLVASVLQDVGLLNRSRELLCFVGANCLVNYSSRQRPS